MPTDWDKIAEKAAQETNEELHSEISSLVSLKNKDIEELILETGISQKDLIEVLKLIKEATVSNEAKATAIKNIGKGVDVLVGIAGKFL